MTVEIPLFPGRLGLIQRVLPAYRVPFFDLLAENCADGLSVFAGQPLQREGIVTGNPQVARYTPARNLHLFDPQHPLYTCYQYDLTEWLERENPAGVILEANFRYISSPVAIQWMKKRGRPVIGWGLGAPASRALLSRLRNHFLHQFDSLIAYSQRGAEQYAACGFPADKIFVAPNAVTRAPTRPLPPKDPARPPQAVVLFVGRLQPRKRVPALLRACAQLPTQLQPRLVIVGDGPALDSLRDLAQTLYPAAEFPGALQGSELAARFVAADLFVLPGTGGLAVQEAMSYGLPVIVAQADGTQDDLVRPANGWLIPPDDDQALCTAMQQALSDLPNLRTMGQESYRIVCEEINLERMTHVFIHAFAQNDDKILQT